MVPVWACVAEAQSPTATPAESVENEPATIEEDGPGFDLGNILFAGRTRVTPRVSVGTSYTDNVDLEADARSDFVTFIRPGVTLIQTSRRFNTALDFAVSAEYSSDEGGFGLRLTNDSGLNSANRFEVVDDILAFQLNAAISRELIDNGTGVPASVTDRQDNRATVQRYSAGPILTYRFGRLVDTETSLRLGYVNLGEAQDEGDPDIDDDGQSLDIQASQTIASGPLFSTVLWDVGGSYQRSDIGEDEEAERATVAANGEYVIDRTWSLLGTVGFENIDDPDLDEDVDGPFWNAGARVSPNRRLTAEARFGRRFGGDDLFFRLDYEASERLRLNASFERTLETEEQRFLRDLAFIGVDEEGNFVDLRTGLPPSTDSELFGLVEEAVIRERFQTRLDYARRRDDFAVDGIYETREFSDGDEQVIGGSASWRRRLSRETSSVLSFAVRNTDFEDDRTDQLYTFSAGVNHALTQDVAVSFNYVYQNRDSNIEDRNATENFVSLTLTKFF